MKKLKDVKFKDLILHNFAIKIIAVVIAIVLWVVIVNIDNPSRTSTISGIQVVFLNEDELVDKGYTYAVISGAVISITVKAPQTIIEGLEASDFYAYADLSELSPTSDKAKITVRCDKSDVANQVDIVSMKTSYVKLSIDNKISQDFSINANYIGKPAENYVVGDCYVSPATVTVTGAEAIVSSIAEAKVNYNIEGIAHSVNEESKITFYNSNGEEIKTDLLTLSRSTAKLNVDILPTKWVNVNYALSGDAEDGYSISDYEASISSVCVAASRALLESLNSIDIPAGVIDVSKITEATTYEIPLNVYLPSGYRIVSAENTMVVRVNVNKKVEIEVPYENIDLLNQDDTKYKYEIIHKSDNFVITVVGKEEDVEKVEASDLFVKASVNGKTPGTHTIRLTIECGSEYVVDGIYEITVKISEKPTEEETETETTSVVETTDNETDTEEKK